MTPNRIARWGCALAAAGLIAWSSTLPLWTMTMRAPQYPGGLRLFAYGTGMTGDVPELNILNHYLGMPPLHAPALETAMFPFAISALIVLCLLSPLHRLLRGLSIAVVMSAPIAILADLQWRLYEFGHSLNPEAPIRLKAFTPRVIGTTVMGNFTSWGMVSWGIWCLLMAAVLLWTPGLLARRRATRPGGAGMKKAAMVTAAMLVLAGASQPSAQPMALQALIDAAHPDGTVSVPAGEYAGPVTIRGPLTVSTSAGATIDGGGHGSVVVIEFPDGLHEYVTTPVKRVLRLAGDDVFFLQTANSCYRLEVRSGQEVVLDSVAK